MALTATLDRATYAPGDRMTLTVHRGVAGTPTNVTVVETGGSTVAVSATTVSPLTVTDASHTWAKASDDGTTAVYTATA